MHKALGSIPNTVIKMNKILLILINVYTCPIYPSNRIITAIFR